MSLYNKTLELLKSEEHEDFFMVFDKFFQEANKELFKEFQKAPKAIKNSVGKPQIKAKKSLSYYLSKLIYFTIITILGYLIAMFMILEPIWR